MKFKCQGCGKEATFKTSGEARMAGWDFATCPNCPSAPFIIQRHLDKEIENLNQDQDPIETQDDDSMWFDDGKFFGTNN